jgi:hypothetical protein
MANLRMGYIGKSFTLGILGIVGTLVACGGGGVTSTIASTTATPSEHVLFTMGFQPTTDAGVPELKWKTAQGGKVYVGTNTASNANNWTYGGWGTWNQTDIDVKGWVGVQFHHPSALNSNDYMYYRITGRSSGSVDVSATDSLLITMGNEKIGSQANTPTEVTVVVEGGTYTSSNYANSCKATQTLRATTLATNYLIPLSSFTCTSGTMASLKSGVAQVVIKVLPGGGNATADASTADNYTLIQLGSVAFSKNSF